MDAIRSQFASEKLEATYDAVHLAGRAALNYMGRSHLCNCIKDTVFVSNSMTDKSRIQYFTGTPTAYEKNTVVEQKMRKNCVELLADLSMFEQF